MGARFGLKKQSFLILPLSSGKFLQAGRCAGGSASARRNKKNAVPDKGTALVGGTLPSGSVILCSDFARRASGKQPAYCQSGVFKRCFGGCGLHAVLS